MLSTGWLYRSHPVLLQGETSVGKTSLIQWLASATGNHCVRINNHEHTDIQEYIGCYSSDNRGKLVFKEGTPPYTLLGCLKKKTKLMQFIFKKESHWL